METMTTERLGTRNSRTVVTPLAYVGAAAFAIAALWYGLAVEGVTVASEPAFSPSQTVQDRQQIFYRWFVSTLTQERVYTALAIAGFVCLAAVAIALRDRFPGRPSSLVGVEAIGAGAFLWVIGNVLELGGHRAVGLMATHGNPLDGVGSIHFTVDLIDDAFELASFALLGVGMLAFALAGTRVASNTVAWGRYTTVVGLLMLCSAASYVVDNGDLTNVLLLAGGVALLPVWLVWIARLVQRMEH